MLYDALDMKFRELKLRRDPKCPICGENPTITGLVDYQEFCGIGLEPEEPGAHPDEVSVRDLKAAMDDEGKDTAFLDVREYDEVEIARIDGVPVIPLGELPQRFTELDPNQMIYVHCKMGGRSLKAVDFLKQQGFKYCKSVAGGINAWSDEIDSTVPRY
jgi:adenylyltransferase/sulfurtransferase